MSPSREYKNKFIRELDSKRPIGVWTLTNVYALEVYEEVEKNGANYLVTLYRNYDEAPIARDVFISQVRHERKSGRLYIGVDSCKYYLDECMKIN